MKLYLLPGLDGTGKLFAPLLRAAPSWVEPEVLAFGARADIDYPALAQFVLGRIDASRPFLLLGESFSTPAAIMAAADAPPSLAGVILAAGFVTNPRPWLLRLVGREVAGSRPRRVLSARLVRRLFAMLPVRAEVMSLVSAAFGAVPAVVVRRRLDLLRTVDARDALIRCKAPVLYLQAGRDIAVPNAALGQILAVRPDVTVRQIDAPHLLLQTAPQAAWNAITAYASALGALDAVRVEGSGGHGAGVAALGGAGP